jgi:hypothetical protein
MSRNRTPEYINRIRAIEAPNGYKFDIANYLYNPAFGNEYPAFIKMISETEETQTFRRVYYFKYYDGTGEYLAETFTRKKNGENWQIVTGRTEEHLEKANRYNVKKLLTFCEA